MIYISNFRHCKFGLVVTRSDHYYKERGMKIPKQRQLGIVVNITHYMDSTGRMIAWPDIHWEGDVVSSITHPINAVAYRKQETLPMTTMDNGQIKF